jgi:hypothetical protein
VTGTQTADRTGEFQFDLGTGPPVDRLNLELPELNTVTEADFLSRSDTKSPWHPVAQGVFYRLQSTDGGTTQVANTGGGDSGTWDGSIHSGIWQRICHRRRHAIGGTPRYCYPGTRDSQRLEIIGRRDSIKGLQRGVSLEDKDSLGDLGCLRRITRGDGLPSHKGTEYKRYPLN